MTEFYYLRAEDIRIINLAYCGDGAGVRDESGFLGIVDRPMTSYDGTDLFADAFMKATSYLHGFATTQFFRDGNKRTGFLCATVFLQIHGHTWVGPDVDAAEDFLLDVAANKVSIERVAEWLRSHCSQKDPTA